MFNDIHGIKNRLDQISSILTDLQCIVGNITQVAGSARTIITQWGGGGGGGNIVELHPQCTTNHPTWGISDFV